MREAAVREEESFAAAFAGHSEKPPMTGDPVAKFVGICDE